MADLNDVRNFLGEETGLSTISTTQAGGRVLSSIVNCGVMDHPVTGEPTVAMVSRGNAARIGHIRRGSEVTVAVRRGWAWVSVTGAADLVAPNELAPGMDADGYRMLLREIFTACGGTHDNWAEYDQAMIDDGRIAVFVNPDRILGVTPGA